MNTTEAELAETRRFLERLTSGKLRLILSRRDHTRREILVCEREIAFLEHLAS